MLPPRSGNVIYLSICLTEKYLLSLEKFTIFSIVVSSEKKYLLTTMIIFVPLKLSHIINLIVLRSNFLISNKEPRENKKNC